MAIRSPHTPRRAARSARRPAGRSTRRSGPILEWPLVLVVLVLIAGVLQVAGILPDFHGWRRGSVLIGCGIGLAGLLRLLLSDQQAGLLRVRRKTFDVGLLMGLGIAIIVMAFWVPPMRN